MKWFFVGFVLTLIFIPISVESQVGNIEYYGYYCAPWWTPEGDEVTNRFSNLVIYGDCWKVASNPEKFLGYIDYCHERGLKIICDLHPYFVYENTAIDETEMRSFLNDLKTNLGDKIEDIYAFYLIDEPWSMKYPGTNTYIFRHNPERLETVINTSKEYLPDKNTLIVFNQPWITAGYIVHNEKLDLIGLDPYFLNKDYANSVAEPFECNQENKKQFDKVVKLLLYWAKTGEYACLNGGNRWPNDCTTEEVEEINNVLSSDTDKDIMMFGQAFMSNEYGALWDIGQIPSICQQEWYYDYSKNDPDVVAHFWYRYSSEDEKNKYDNAVSSYDLGVGKHTPEMLNQHRLWGLEVLCENQEIGPFVQTTA